MKQIFRKEANSSSCRVTERRHVDGDSTQRITIHGPRLKSNAHLLELLSAGVWLAEQANDTRRGPSSIEVLLHPLGSPWIRLVAILFRPGTIPAFLRKVLNCDERPGRSDTEMQRSGTTIIEEVRGGSSPVSLHVNEDLKLTIKRVRPGYVKTACWTLRAAWNALRCLNACYSKRRLNVHKFLSLSDRGIQIGDLVVSDTISIHPDSGGRVRHCSILDLFIGLTNAIYTISYIQETAGPWHGPGAHYVAISERTYLEGIYPRALRQRGVPFLELYDYSGRLRIVAPDDEVPNPSVARPPDGRPLSHREREAAHNYLAERVSETGRLLWYMNVGRNTNAGDRVVDDRGNVIAHDRQRLTIVMCLHSFDDALYWYGNDGFEDLYEWTVVSIDECLQNPQVGRVLIKEHPNVDPIEFLGDKHAVRLLRARYSEHPKVRFIDRRTNVNALNSLGYVYGITNHGSIAEELVGAGLPVIASSKGPWGAHYPFPRLWHSPEEYVTILRGLTVEDWCPPTEAENEALAQFINEYRLIGPPDQDLPIWLQWMLWQDGSVDILARDIAQRVERKIAELEPDSPQLIEWLRDRMGTCRVDREREKEQEPAFTIRC